MQEKIRQLLEDFMSQGTQEELENLQHILNGLQKKQAEKKSSYINGLFHMDPIITDKGCEISMPLYSYLNNSFHIVHGGVTATLLDTAMGTLANKLLPSGYHAVTSQLNVHYIAPGKGEFLTCKAELNHKGSNVLLISGEVLRSDGKKIAYATGTFFIIKPFE